MGRPKKYAMSYFPDHHTTNNRVGLADTFDIRCTICGVLLYHLVNSLYPLSWYLLASEACKLCGGGLGIFDPSSRKAYLRSGTDIAVEVLTHSLHLIHPKGVLIGLRSSSSTPNTLIHVFKKPYFVHCYTFMAE